MAILSVILCCRNDSALIDVALQSVIHQTVGFDSLQVICVDDASEDDTLEHLKQYEAKYPDQFLIVHNEICRHLGNARNISLSYVDAPYFTFLDADDYLEPDALERMLEVTKDHAYDIVMSRFIIDETRPDLPLSAEPIPNRVLSDPSRAMTVNSPENRKLFYFLQPLYGYACAKLIRTDFAREHELTFLPNTAYQDQFWGSLVHIYAKEVYLLEERLYHYYKNEQSTVHRKNTYQSLDLLTVHGNIKAELFRRNMENLLADEFDFLLLFNCYLSFFKMLIYRYETPDYSLYLLAREFVQATLFHEIRSNPYVQSGALTEVQSLLLTTLEQPLTKEEFLQLTAAIEAGSLLNNA